jgi:uncharacterized membrane protein YdjX (TVP38/TMEM64 family)
MNQSQQQGKRQGFGRWLVVGVLALAAILIPFAAFGRSINAWTDAFLLTAAGHPAVTSVVLGGLLASDIFLPVPSSIVSTACGWTLGAGRGTIVSLAGMTVSCIAGFAMGRVLGAGAVARFVGGAEMARVAGLNRRYGDWIVILARPVPVLAEASVLFAGLGAMTWRRFLALSTLSNLGVSAVYAGVGATSGRANTFLPALAASILLPWVVMGAANGYAKTFRSARSTAKQTP